MSTPASHGENCGGIRILFFSYENLTRLTKKTTYCFDILTYSFEKKIKSHRNLLNAQLEKNKCLKNLNIYLEMSFFPYKFPVL